MIGTTLRFTPNLSVFSSIPVVIAREGAEAPELYFPQVAGGGGFSTMFVLLNPGDSAITATLELFRLDGSPLQMNLNGAINSTFAVNIPANGLRILESPNTGALQAGWARVVASGPIGGSILYGFAAVPGTSISEAGINPATQTDGFAFSVDTRQGFLSGLAVAAPGLASVSVALTLYDRSGNLMTQQSRRDLPTMSYFAEMVEQLFPEANVINFKGVIVVTATGGRIIGTTLRFSPDLSIFASIPVT